MSGLTQTIDVGTTPKTLVYRDRKLALYRYDALKPLHENPVKTPLLIVYALVNRPYILDLQPNKSLVLNLLAQGFDIFLIDWGYPDPSDRYLTLEDYILDDLSTCVDQVCHITHQAKLNMLGVCQGGVFSLCYSAIFPEKIRNLITMVTPVDFSTPDNLLTHLLKSVDVDLLVDATGNMPGDALNIAYLGLKPYELTSKKYVDMQDIVNDPVRIKDFMRMEKWIFDSPDQAGEAFREFVKVLFQENQLVKGKMTLDGYRVDLKKLTMPILNIYALRDHLVPPSASMALRECVGSKDYTELGFDTGHIGIYVSGRAQKVIPPHIGKWLRER